jgi:hypothetical protein
MTGRLQELALRRRELIERSRTQRAALMAGTGPLLAKAAALDRLVASARRHPIVTVLGAGAVMLLASRKAFDLATRVATLYALFRR